MKRESDKQIALITGMTGQDGSYLAEFLLEKGYEVHGVIRRTSSNDFERLEEVLDADGFDAVTLHYGDLADSSSLNRIVSECRPTEIYNLGAQSHVQVSFDTPEYTGDINGLGTLRLLEAIRTFGLTDCCKFYQASTSELFGMVRETPQKESTPFYPRSPYAVAKMYAYWMVVNYREAYGIYACNGLLFNHESPRRGSTFVTRKITIGLSEVALGMRKSLKMGNINALRDWGHARDFVEMQWLMLQQDKPDDYVIATGEQYSIKQFVTWAAEELGIGVEFRGEGLNECGIITSIEGELAEAVSVGDKIIEIDPAFLRPTEVESLLGDSQKALTKLGWKPKISVKEMCAEMVREDYKAARGRKYLSKL